MSTRERERPEARKVAWQGVVKTGEKLYVLQLMGEVLASNPRAFVFSSYVTGKALNAFGVTNAIKIEEPAEKAEEISITLDKIGAESVSVDEKGRFVVTVADGADLSELDRLKMDPKSAVFFKREAQARSPTYIRFPESDDSTFASIFNIVRKTSFINEYAALVQTSDAVPEYTAKPLGVIVDRSGKMRAYLMEKVCGSPLILFLEYQEIVGDMTKFRVMEQCKDFIGTLHAAGMAHGDFNPRNIIVQKDGRIKVIDSIGFHTIPMRVGAEEAVIPDPSMLEALQKADRSWLHKHEMEIYGVRELLRRDIEKGKGKVEKKVSRISRT